MDLQRPMTETPTPCPSCGTPRAGKFCSDCGERRVDPREFGILHFASQVTAGLTDLDGRVLGSLRSLIFAPGRLTARWIAGRRVQYLRPFQLFLLVNVAVDLIASLCDVPSWATTSAASDFEPWARAMEAQAERMGMTVEQHRAMYDKRASGIARGTIAWTILLAAVITWLFHCRRERRGGIHLVFATHLVAFFLVIPDLLFSGVLSPYVRGIEVADESSKRLLVWLCILLPTLPLTLWWWVADRRSYGSSWLGAALRALLGSVLFYVVGLFAHQAIVFWVTIRVLE